MFERHFFKKILLQIVLNLKVLVFHGLFFFSSSVFSSEVSKTCESFLTTINRSVLEGSVEPSVSKSENAQAASPAPIAEDTANSAAADEDTEFWSIEVPNFDLSDEQRAVVQEIETMSLWEAKKFLDLTLVETDPDTDFHKARVAALLQRIFSLRGESFLLQFDPDRQASIKILPSSNRLGRLASIVQRFYSLDVSYRPYYLRDDTLAFAWRGEEISLSHASALGFYLDPTTAHEMQHLAIWEQLSMPPQNGEFHLLNAELVRGPGFETHGYDRLSFTEFSTWWGDLVRELRRHELYTKTDEPFSRDLKESRLRIFGISENLKSFAGSVNQYLDALEDLVILDSANWKLTKRGFENEIHNAFVRIEAIESNGGSRLKVTLSSQSPSKSFRSHIQRAHQSVVEQLSRANPEQGLSALYDQILQNIRMEKTSRLDLVFEGQNANQIIEEIRSMQISETSHSLLLGMIDRKLAAIAELMNSVQGLSEQVQGALRQSRSSQSVSNLLLQKVFGSLGERSVTSSLDAKFLTQEAMKLSSHLGFKDQARFDALLLHWDEVHQRYESSRRSKWVSKILKAELDLLDEDAAEEKVDALAEGLDEIHQKAVDRIFDIWTPTDGLSLDQMAKIDSEILAEILALGFTSEQAQQILDAKLVGNFEDL